MRPNHSRFLLLILVTLCIGITYGQDDDRSFGERLRFGGDVIASFGTVTALGASPFVGYEVSERYIPGIGGTYIYLSANGIEQHQYGVRNFHRFLVTEELFVHGEFEYLSFRVNTSNDVGGQTLSAPAILLGGGYRQPLGENSFFIMSVLYDVLEDPNSPYSGPIIRGGVSIGR